MSKISVIIPVYNCEKYIAETLDSIIHQSFIDWEAICIDDGSNDNSLKILEKYADKDNRIKVITQKNLGVVTARNVAINQAKSEYVFPLDADDIITSDCLEKLYRAMLDGKGDIITCRVMYFGRETHEMELKKATKYNMIHENCLVNAALFRKSDFEKSGGYDTEFNIALEDYDFWLNMVINHKKKIYRIPEILFYYRLKPKSEARNFQHRSEHAMLQNKLQKKYPIMKKYFLFEKLTKPIRKIARFVFRIEGNEIKLFKKIRFKIKKHINLFYFNSVSNFGDILNLDILEKLSDHKIQHKCLEKADIVAIGSLLQAVVVPKIKFKNKINRILRKPLIVYGTGFIEDSTDKNALRSLDVRAVRGKNSLEKLSKLKYVKISKNVAIGDPGLLASLLINSSKIEKKYSLGIIPHYVDSDNQLLNKIKVKNSIVLDIKQPPYILLTQMAQCEYIISSAMHGLIAADSLGIPNIRIILSNKITGGDYKYDDYYSAFGIKKHNRFDLRKKSFTDKDLKQLSKMYQIKPEQVHQKQKELLEALPFKTKGKIYL